MNGLYDWAWNYDGWIMLTGVLCAVAAALPGNFLVLRRMSLLGDAISHAVLPGIAAAFLLTHSRSSLPMFLGAVIVGVMTAFFTEWIRRTGEVDEGASTGVVFTTLFALGLVMIVRAADHVDLDPGCVLYGAIEMTPLDTLSLGYLRIPRATLILGLIALLNLLFVVFFFKELRITAFDPALADSLGISSGRMHYLLMIVVAVTAVASFESVGNILVVAMFVVPPATAYLLSDRLPVMVILSVVIAVVSAVLGDVCAVHVPAWFGFQSTSTSGMMALITGVLFLIASILAPRQGVLVRFLRQRELLRRILSEDLIALLYRMHEHQPDRGVSLEELTTVLLAGKRPVAALMSRHVRAGHVREIEGTFSLTEKGRQLGASLVRSHRLWEHYLVSEGGVAVDRIHNQAEQLEHFTGRELRDRLHEQTATPTVDPHGRPIPPE